MEDVKVGVAYDVVPLKKDANPEPAVILHVIDTVIFEPDGTFAILVVREPFVPDVVKVYTPPVGPVLVPFIFATRDAAVRPVSVYDVFNAPKSVVRPKPTCSAELGTVVPIPTPAVPMSPMVLAYMFNPPVPVVAPPTD